MEIINRIPRMRLIVNKLRKNNRKIGFVPTMGALHEGHLSLINYAQRMSDVVVVSIFVNPLQFGPNEDFERYPRDLAHDAELIASRGVDYLFAPNSDEMYPEDFLTVVDVNFLGNYLCGASRPGHFRGVTTVVNKLLNIVHPDFVFFGQKDIQQTLIIRRMVSDLCIDTEVAICPTIRELDGLAMSSRNQYLNPEERKASSILICSLELAQKKYIDGERDTSKVVTMIRDLIENEPLARIDYIEIVDPDSLNRVETLDENKPILIAIAVFIGNTRLIDNIILNTPTQA